MDEESLWQADLARRNINILGLDGPYVYYEFQYHPAPGTTRWCKTMMVLDDSKSGLDYDPVTGVTQGWSVGFGEIAEQVTDHALRMRKELEK